MNKKKAVRMMFRDNVFTRDWNTCKVPLCGETKNLDAHHITDRNLMPNGGYVVQNGISLCPKHHEMAEEWHSSKGAKWPEGFHPEDLYKLIGSSYAAAHAASQRLK